jgi:hypothetical protein
MIKAVEFCKEIRAGSSLPLIVGGSDGEKYVVKLRGSGEGVLANIVEFLALKLGRLMQIPVLEPVCLLIETDFTKKTNDPEIRELLERSIGINFATKHVEATSFYNEQSASLMAPEMRDDIFLYDLFLLNIDRNASNPNIIFNRNGPWCLDYASAVTIRSAVTGKNYKELSLLKEMKRHLFCRDHVDAYTFIGKFREIPDCHIGDMTDELPEEWPRDLKMKKEDKDAVAKRLITEKNNVAVLLKRLDMLRILRLETEEERRIRTLQNKKAFEQKFGKL